ncbi:very short patch repair endonuclease [Paludibacterium paludis]|uniref:very short patch repair endonuclease n=1 Tax=Paludibacterium paludis TaxID=1225769 RepID=UPI00167367F6|nr:very short patch repair endonuclease [Paludibacterium paludis]
MADIVDRATRSRMMSGIKNKDTKPEVFVRKALHARGFRYRLHVKNIPGKPDLVFPKYKALVFINGCFWHGHDCHYFKLPSTRTAFWQKKIESNRQRDSRQLTANRAAGWKTLVVWECAIRGAARTAHETLVKLICDWLTMENEDKQIKINNKTERNSCEIQLLSPTETEQ